MENTPSGVELFVIIIVVGGMWLLPSWINYQLAKKFGEDGSFWTYLIPIYGNYKLLKITNQNPVILFAWYLLPYANLIFMAYNYGQIAKQLGKSSWAYGLGFFLFVPILLLAFGDSKVSCDRFCTKCGTKNKSDDKFCQQCGNELF